jgi:dTDP-4-dehydrorhamnose reductase
MVNNLIIGANGLIGRAIGNEFKGDFIGTCYNRSENRLVRMDITNHAEVKKIINKNQPKICYFCANLSGGVNRCEKEPELAKKYHYDSVINIAELCNRTNAKIVFLSSDYVFDGKKEYPYKENDKKNPLNIYGKLKSEAEEWIVKNIKKYLIIRTTNVYGWDPKTVTPNFIMNLYKQIKIRKKFKAQTYLFGNPIYVRDLAKAIIELCKTDRNGIYHIVGDHFINRYEWADSACRVLGLDRKYLEKDNKILADHEIRPQQISLDNAKIKNECSISFSSIESGLTKMKNEMNRLKNGKS